ncbi:hypothetical protein LJB42_003295 [Komagataella kurtzmanii]|nr:hypothetical protein LJB42_003295 [Komagataella kurtzmanii]
MGRVNGSKRIRRSYNCGPCKRQKIKCDTNLPCSNCVKYKRVAKCYQEPPNPPTEKEVLLKLRKKRRLESKDTVLLPEVPSIRYPKIEPEVQQASGSINNTPIIPDQVPVVHSMPLSMRLAQQIPVIQTPVEMLVSDRQPSSSLSSRSENCSGGPLIPPQLSYSDSQASDRLPQAMSSFQSDDILVGSTLTEIDSRNINTTIQLLKNLSRKSLPSPDAIRWAFDIFFNNVNFIYGGISKAVVEKKLAVFLQTYEDDSLVDQLDFDFISFVYSVLCVSLMVGHGTEGSSPVINRLQDRYNMSRLALVDNFFIKSRTGLFLLNLLKTTLVVDKVQTLLTLMHMSMVSKVFFLMASPRRDDYFEQLLNNVSLILLRQLGNRATYNEENLPGIGFDLVLQEKMKCWWWTCQDDTENALLFFRKPLLRSFDSQVPFPLNIDLDDNKVTSYDNIYAYNNVGYHFIKVKSLKILNKLFYVKSIIDSCQQKNSSCDCFRSLSLLRTMVRIDLELREQSKIPSIFLLDDSDPKVLKLDEKQQIQRAFQRFLIVQHLCLYRFKLYQYSCRFNNGLMNTICKILILQLLWMLEYQIDHYPFSPKTAVYYRLAVPRMVFNVLTGFSFIGITGATLTVRERFWTKRVMRKATAFLANLINDGYEFTTPKASLILLERVNAYLKSQGPNYDIDFDEQEAFIKEMEELRTSGGYENRYSYSGADETPRDPGCLFLPIALNKWHFDVLDCLRIYGTQEDLESKLLSVQQLVLQCCMKHSGMTPDMVFATEVAQKPTFEDDIVCDDIDAYAQGGDCLDYCYTPSNYSRTLEIHGKIATLQRELGLCYNILGILDRFSD